MIVDGSQAIDAIVAAKLGDADPPRLFHENVAASHAGDAYERLKEVFGPGTPPPPPGVPPRPVSGLSVQTTPGYA